MNLLGGHAFVELVRNGDQVTCALVWKDGRRGPSVTGSPELIASAIGCLELLEMHNGVPRLKAPPCELKVVAAEEGP